MTVPVSVVAFAVPIPALGGRMVKSVEVVPGSRCVLGAICCDDHCHNGGFDHNIGVGVIGIGARGRRGDGRGDHCGRGRRSGFRGDRKFFDRGGGTAHNGWLNVGIGDGLDSTTRRGAGVLSGAKMQDCIGAGAAGGGRPVVVGVGVGLGAAC